VFVVTLGVSFSGEIVKVSVEMVSIVEKPVEELDGKVELTSSLLH
jgi:hypothetical protein